MIDPNSKYSRDVQEDIATVRALSGVDEMQAIYVGPDAPWARVDDHHYVPCNLPVSCGDVCHATDPSGRYGCVATWEEHDEAGTA